MIGVIADDLTGAAELGAVGLRHGLRAEIVVPNWKSRLQAVNSSGPAKTEALNADLACVDTDSRACPPGEAGRRAAAAADVLLAGEAEWIYKKTDSVLRGPVLAEIEAILQRLGLERAFLVPANPALGRVIRRGQYFIHGKPIHKTQFADDPSYPRTSSDVRDLLGTPGALPVYVATAQGPLVEIGIVVGEAQSEDDLQKWAARLDSGTLAAGGAEFFGALLEATGHPVVSVRPAIRAGRQSARELFVCGTTTKSARAFLQASRRQGVPIFSLPAELAQGVARSPEALEAIARQTVAALQTHRRVILNVGLPLVRDRAISERLARHLTDVAALVLQRGGAGHVHAEGGATAVALAKRMGWSRLTVLRELAPGVATLRVAGARPLLFTIKPGSYSWPADVRNQTLKAG